MSRFRGVFDRYAANEFNQPEAADLLGIGSELPKPRDLGPRIALHDFGTGCSSLSYLRSFPLDMLKIDQSFVRETGTRPGCRAIVHSMATPAFGIRIIRAAEWIEAEEPLQEVCLVGSAEAQRYEFDRPMPEEVLRRSVASACQ